MGNKKIIILGAGLSGLELGRLLNSRDIDFTILEKESESGGLCRTNNTKGYLWDFGVHALYSRDRLMKKYFDSLAIPKTSLARKVRIFHTGFDKKRYLLDYPFEIGVRGLPEKEKLECIEGFLEARRNVHKKVLSLRDWIENFSGKGIAKYFMFPYNHKIWDCSLSKISAKLVASKIDPPGVEEFLNALLDKRIAGRPYQANFVYPKNGIQELIKYISRGILDKVVLGATVKSLIKSKNGWSVNTTDGKTYEAGTVISTIPLPELLKSINLKGIARSYNVFKHNDTCFVMAGLKKGRDFKQVKDCHWVFFKEKEVFYRATLMRNFSARMPPAIVAEITLKSGLRNKEIKWLKQRAVTNLVSLGIIGSKKDVEVIDAKVAGYTYPIPTIGLDHIKEKIAQRLKKENLFLLGRNGNWDYINMDEVIINARNFFSGHFL